MSGVLQPVGPEAARTYWIRRGLVLAVVLALALGVIVAVANLTRAAVVTSPPPVVAPATSPTPAPVVPVSDATSPSGASASPSQSIKTPATPSASTATTAATLPAAKPAPKAATSTTPKASAAPRTPKPSATPTKPPACRPNDLRATVKGDQTLAPKEKNTLSLSLINGGAQGCLVSVDDQNFELKIYSGKDRIWSSRDCPKALKAFDRVLAPQAGVAWKMTWDGRRSAKGKNCRRQSEIPRPGTYWATAQLDGAKPVQLRMVIS